MQSHNIKTKSAIMLATLNLAHTYARSRSQAPILILGETGTGKTHLAEQIHAWTGRTGPFEVLDCAALSAGVIESELFGHARGAFTNADRSRKGAFERADGGTIFIDEIGELPLELQPRLLRVVQTRVFRPVGGDRDVKVDVRIIAATNRDLDADVEAGRFRPDLYSRLSQFSVTMPPLRDRIEDIPDLVSDFNLPNDVVELLKSYQGPGNVRGLRNHADKFSVLELTADQVREHLEKHGRKTCVETPKSKPTRDDRWQFAVALSESRKNSGGWWSTPELAQMAGCSLSAAYRDAQHWTADKLLEKRGSKQTARYRSLSVFERRD